jgi:hypothetical protein
MRCINFISLMNNSTGLLESEEATRGLKRTRLINSINLPILSRKSQYASPAANAA